MALQVAAQYTFVGGDGTRFVVNGDGTDPDYVGRLDADAGVTGLDSPDVRENADVLVEDDGGVHGNFYFGRRPVVFKGWIDVSGVQQSVNARVDKVQRAINTCLRQDGSVTWTEDGTEQRKLLFRAQQPLRITSRRPKVFLLPLVSKDAPIFGSTVYSQSIPALGSTALPGFSFPLHFNVLFGTGAPAGVGTITNAGTFPSLPDHLRIDGPIVNPVLRNATTSEDIRLITNVLAGHWIDLYPGEKSILLDGVTDIYDSLDFPNSSWWRLLAQPSTNDIRLLAASYSAPAALTVAWRSAFI